MALRILLSFLGGQLSEGICPAGKHKWKHDQCMVCAVCGECTGYGASCVSSGRPDRNPGTLCGCGSGDSGCADCGCCRTCAGEEGDLVGAAAAAAAAADMAPVRDLIRLDLLAAGGQLPPVSNLSQLPIHLLLVNVMLEH